ncbi:hypothetical protein PFICI_06778 [Pestalotiopsis fici W106-1]|uniref:ORP1 like protein n=1 Tax=Pestalotiopsis fici (strain W106-1 / CGMCC3.15140) TaxID=1229662 RepID=W3X9E5_PESFW|nr:uncharacterized protein PFICI_06778 [Pestalotiopsis fici W106-1]ETS81776.1 hypothetical protein PFICI_06778 [Pestalotiopsis fici W106-1]
MLNSGARRDAGEQSESTSVSHRTSAWPSSPGWRTSSRRTSESRTTKSTRTPWNADGYSMPLTLDTKTVTQPSVRPSFFGSSPIDSASPPKSPRHKCSDSQSTISSYNSPLHSNPHSRFSSVSTVGGFNQTTGALITDPAALTALTALESRSCDNLDSAVSLSSMPEWLPGKLPRMEGGISPTTIAEEPDLSEYERPGSPSDAMLIRRDLQSSDRMSPQDLTNPDPKSFNNFLALPGIPKSHKRAVSAPDFAAANTAATLHRPTTPPHQLRTPRQQGEDRTGCIMDEIDSEEDSPIYLPSPDEPVKCMYAAKCSTGSSPRKAISHIFGRNKTCTRNIPPHVWVHFCRKHYQRTRYRNNQEYNKLQALLVLKQIRRIQVWSDGNRKADKSGVVRNWSLSVRKREQKRLDERGAIGQKRRRSGDNSEDDEDDDTEVIDQTPTSGTAVPGWLLKKCGSGYSTEQILEVVKALRAEIVAGKLSQIPDIEILPNIESSEDGKAKAPMKRKTSTSSHKRSRSVGYGQGYAQDISPMMRRTSQPGANHGHRPSLSRVPESMVPPTMGHGQHAMLPHRPASYTYDNNMRETPVQESYYDSGVPRSTPYAFGGPLPPVATAHRLGQTTNAQQLEANRGYYESRHFMHQRASSEAGLFPHHAQFTYRSSYQPYPSETAYQPATSSPYDAYSAPGYNNGGGPPGYYDNVPYQQRSWVPQQAWGPAPEPQQSPYAMPRHGRHQSASAVHQSTPQLPYPRMGNNSGDMC